MCRPVIAQDFLEALKVVRPYLAMPQKQRARKRAKNSSDSDRSSPITPQKKEVAPSPSATVSHEPSPSATVSHLTCATLQGARTVTGVPHQVQCQVKQEHAYPQIVQS